VRVRECVCVCVHVCVNANEVYAHKSRDRYIELSIHA